MFNRDKASTDYLERRREYKDFALSPFIGINEIWKDSGKYKSSWPVVKYAITLATAITVPVILVATALTALLDTLFFLPVAYFVGGLNELMNRKPKEKQDETNKPNEVEKSSLAKLGQEQQLTLKKTAPQHPTVFSQANVERVANNLKDDFKQKLSNI